MERTKQQKAARSQAEISQKKTILLSFFDSCEKKIWVTPRIEQRKLFVQHTNAESTLDSYFSRIEHAYTQWLRACSASQVEAYHDLCTSHTTTEQQEARDLNMLLDQI